MPWFLGWGISWTFLTNSKTSKVLGKIQTLTLGHFLRYSVGDRELLEIVSRKYGFSKIKMCRFKIMASRGVWSLYWATYIVRELHGQPHSHKWAYRWVTIFQLSDFRRRFPSRGLVREGLQLSGQLHQVFLLRHLLRQRVLWWCKQGRMNPFKSCILPYILKRTWQL